MAYMLRWLASAVSGAVGMSVGAVPAGKPGEDQPRAVSAPPQLSFPEMRGVFLNG